MPVHADRLERGGMPALEVTGEREAEDHAKGDETKRDVEPVKTREREERGREQARVHRQPAREQLLVFAPLPGHEERAEHERREEPATEGALPPCGEALLGHVDREAAREEADHALPKLMRLI